MTDYHSGSTLRQHRQKDFFVPTKLVWLLYAIISLVVLILLNAAAIVQVFLVQPVTAQELVPLTDKLSQFQDKLNTPIVMIFWLFIGAATYTIIWLAENVLFIARTQVAESQYVARSPTARQQYWQSAVASNVFLVFIVLLWVSFIAFYLRVLLPTFATLFHKGLYSAPVYQRFVDILAAILGNIVAIYIILLLRRLITQSWRANRP